MTEKIWDSLVPISVYFKSEELLILTTCASWPNIERVFAAAAKIDRRVIFITMDWGPTYQESADSWRRFLPFKDFVYFLSNDQVTHDARCAVGLQSSLVNHNAWINEDVFRCSGQQKLYDAVLTARAKKWKRIGLSRQVDNLALVINRWKIDAHRGENDDSYLDIPAKYLNDRKLNKEELADLYCQSRVGLLLSDFEGASYTSSEYLLCGLPVVSTRPEDGVGLGGREFWYTDDNSLLCEPSEAAVRDAVYTLIGRNPDPAAIRHDHIVLMEILRERFLEEVLMPVFGSCLPAFDVRTFFYDTLFDEQTKECRLKSEGKARSYDEVGEIFSC